MPTLTRDDLLNFTGNLQYRLKLLAQTRQHTDRLLATRFNVFDYIALNENRLSDVIKNLIDPNGPHGQGDAFLKEFIEVVCGLTPSAWEFPLDSPRERNLDDFKPWSATGRIDKVRFVRNRY